MGDVMEKYILTSNDINNNFFHFTYQKNLKSISDNGLIPNIGYNARNIEKTKKVFFVEGLDNLLILFDCWINCLYYIPVIPLIYKLGAFFLKYKWFPTIIGDSYFKVLNVSKLHQKRSFKKMDHLLDNGILLNLNLVENIDFKYNDNDEIKMRGYTKKHLEICGYSKKYSDLDSLVMERWNMHTLSNKVVDHQKIKICVLENGSTKLRDIFNYCLQNTKIDLEKTCPELLCYLKYKNSEVLFDGEKSH